MASELPTTDDPTLFLPRILCLYGGGTNATIFRMQCRAIVAELKSDFRLVFAEAPFASQAGPDVLSVYSDYGPFKRWLRWRPEQPEVRAEDIVRELDRCLADTKSHDDMLGATSKWVALLGFSQGAKVCASLLYRQQARTKLYGKHIAGSDFRFGILLAGRGLLISLDAGLILDPSLPDASQVTDFQYMPRYDGHTLRVPTIHVHGLRDPGLEFHRQLFEEFCTQDTRKLIEWGGDH